jgi:hypothetical protein
VYMEAPEIVLTLRLAGWPLVKNEAKRFRG